MKNVIYSLIAILLSLLIGHAIFFLIGGIPASLYGMLFLTISLQFKLINAEKLSHTVQWIIDNMGICFVPAAVGIIEYVYLLKEFGLSITLISVITTLILIAMVGYLYQTFVSNHKHINNS